MSCKHELDARPCLRTGVRLIMGVASRDARAASMMSPATLAAVGSFLAFDFGIRRIGVASGNSLTRSARAQRTLSATGEARFDAIAAMIREWRPDALVVGVPRHPDGAAHENTRRAQRFARQLQARFGLPVHEVDERYSTVEARAAGASDLDAASAAIILEQFLRGIDA